LERTHHFEGLLILLVIFALGGLYLWQNNQPAVTVAVPAASATPTNAPPADWQVALEAQVALAGTPLPTPDVNLPAFVPPTLPPAENTGDQIVQPGEIPITPWPTATPRPATVAPTLPNANGATPFPSPTGLVVADAGEIQGFQPPPEQVPISRQPNDHYWLMRPVNASANSESIFFYPYGSNGPYNDWRVHHGVDIPNDIGAPIQAGGSGTVIYAGKGGDISAPAGWDIYTSYGNVVVIEHDFGYRGQRIYTLYAHMSSIVAVQGQHVEAGDIIGLVGGTGDVSGPHVHLEVRVGDNTYFTAYNPLLWVAPYLGHGVVAGRVTNSLGDFVEDVTVTLTSKGRVSQTTTTYIDAKLPAQVRDWHVVPDPAWNENFVMGDVPEGEYTITVTVNGQRFTKQITVVAATTTFVELGAEIPATPQPVGDDS
jgi:murein DD-endopeptidase MepM/ murein hydrolase activator NlpD